MIIIKRNDNKLTVIENKYAHIPVTNVGLKKGIFTALGDILNESHVICRRSNVFVMQI